MSEVDPVRKLMTTTGCSKAEAIAKVAAELKAEKPVKESKHLDDKTTDPKHARGS